MVCRELSNYALANKHGTKYEYRPFKRQIFFFKAAKVELKRIEKGDTEHYPAIKSDDLVKQYSSVLFNQNTPIALANKIQFDIRLFFCRRGLKICISCRKAHSRSLKQMVEMQLFYRFLRLPRITEMTRMLHIWLSSTGDP